METQERLNRFKCSEECENVVVNRTKMSVKWIGQTTKQKRNLLENGMYKNISK